ncbi:hypothetical protein D3C73_677540 [compost metagenome]
MKGINKEKDHLGCRWSLGECIWVTYLVSRETAGIITITVQTIMARNKVAFRLMNLFITLPRSWFNFVIISAKSQSTLLYPPTIDFC